MCIRDRSRPERVDGPAGPGTREPGLKTDPGAANELDQTVRTTHRDVHVATGASLSLHRPRRTPRSLACRRAFAGLPAHSSTDSQLGHRAKDVVQTRSIESARAVLT